jgi:hypothetical protein
MGESFVSPLANLVVTGSATASNKIAGLKDCRAIGIFAAGTAFTGTIKVQVAPVSGAQMRDLTSAGADVLIQAGDCLVISDIVFEQIRLLSTAAEAARRPFAVIKRWES